MAEAEALAASAARAAFRPAPRPYAAPVPVAASHCGAPDSLQVRGEMDAPSPVLVWSRRSARGRLKKLARTAITCSRLFSPRDQIIRRVEGRRPSGSSAPRRISSSLSRRTGPFPPAISVNCASENKYSSVPSSRRLM